MVGVLLLYSSITMLLGTIVIMIVSVSELKRLYSDPDPAPDPTFQIIPDPAPDPAPFPDPGQNQIFLRTHHPEVFRIGLLYCFTNF